MSEISRYSCALTASLKPRNIIQCGQRTQLFDRVRKCTNTTTNISRCGLTTTLVALVVLTFAVCCHVTAVAGSSVESSFVPASSYSFGSLFPPAAATAGSPAGHLSHALHPAPLSFVDPCYDDSDQARRCVPSFVNAAFGRQVTASSTCGDPPSRLPTSLVGGGGGRSTADRRRRKPPSGDGSGSAKRSRSSSVQLTAGDDVSICDAADPLRRHPAGYLTDLNNPSNRTCWVSEPQWPDDETANVSITLSFGKKYEITYVSLQFCTLGTPDHSVAILKSVDHGRTWSPFQFYSDQCRRVYGRPFRQHANRSNEQEALCSDFGTAKKSSAGSERNEALRLAFSTLEGRPSASDFDSSPVLQDWVTATDIRIVLQPTWTERRPTGGGGGAIGGDRKSVV